MKRFETQETLCWAYCGDVVLTLTACAAATIIMEAAADMPEKTARAQQAKQPPTSS